MLFYIFFVGIGSVLEQFSDAPAPISIPANQTIINGHITCTNNKYSNISSFSYGNFCLSDDEEDFFSNSLLKAKHFKFLVRTIQIITDIKFF